MEKTYRIHFIYIIIILVSIIIYLLTTNYGGNETLISYVSFAVGQASILLAIITIIYSFISNQTISSNLFSITDAAKKISVESNNLNTMTDKLIRKMEEVTGLVSGVDKKVDDSIGTMSIIRQELMTKTAEKMDNIIQGNEKINIEINESLLAQLLRKLSFHYLAFLYVLSISYKFQKHFDCDDYIKSLKDVIPPKDYLYGGLVIFSSLGILKYEGEKDKPWLIKQMNDYICKNVKNSLDVVFKKYMEEDAANKTLTDIWTNSKKQIEIFADLYMKS